MLLLLRYRMDLLVFSKTAEAMFFPSQSLADLFPLEQKCPCRPRVPAFTGLPDTGLLTSRHE